VSIGADADHISRAAAVEEVTVDGVRQVRAFDESAECLRELAPVGDKGRGIDRAFFGEADEGGGRGAHAFDGP